MTRSSDAGTDRQSSCIDRRRSSPTSTTRPGAGGAGDLVTESAAGATPSAAPEATRSAHASPGRTRSPAPRRGAELNGIEYMRALAAGELPPPPIAVLLRMQPVELEPGRAVFEGEPGEEHYNPIGVVHGGYAATLLDSALGCAVHTTLEPARRTRP